ncbi:Uncharacterised protein [Serratia proteamaculans]|nr:Uncharacterised protein [Serratia proteamaculans]CAI1049269.1 Uncharacterised protein [Serratia proteamaculans]
MHWRGLGKCGFRVQGLHDGYRPNGGRPCIPPRYRWRTDRQLVFDAVRRRGNHPAIKLSVFADVNIKPFITREQPALLSHAGVFAVYLRFVNAQRGRARHRTEGETRSAADVFLFAVIFIRVLQTAQGQVTPNIGGDSIPQRLRAGQHRIAPAVQAQFIPRIHPRVNVLTGDPPRTQCDPVVAAGSGKI